MFLVWEAEELGYLWYVQQALGGCKEEDLKPWVWTTMELEYAAKQKVDD